MVLVRVRARLAELVALRLELLGKAVDFVVERLEFRPLGLVLLLQVGEVTLALVGLCHGHLERDNGDLGRAGGRAAAGVAVMPVAGADGVWAAALRARPEASMRTNATECFIRLENSLEIPGALRAFEF